VFSQSELDQKAKNEKQSWAGRLAVRGGAEMTPLLLDAFCF
jgi:hypothetical protein